MRVVQMMKHPLGSLLFLGAFAVSMVTSASEIEPTTLDLQLRFEEGQTFRCTATWDCTDITWRNEAEVEITLFWQDIRGYEVVAVSEAGEAIIKVTHERFEYRQGGACGEYVINSEDESADEPFWPTYWLSALDCSYTIVVTPRGEVVDVSGAEAMRKAVLDSLPEGVEADTVERFKAALTDDSLKDHPVFRADLRPDKPVAVGESWGPVTTTFKLSMYPLLLKNTFTLTSHRDGIVTIECEGPLESDPDEPNGESTVTAQGETTGALKGVLQIDEKTGMIIDGQISTEIKGEFLHTDIPGTEGEKTWPALSETTYTLKVE